MCRTRRATGRSLNGGKSCVKWDLKFIYHHLPIDASSLVNHVFINDIQRWSFHDLPSSTMGKIIFGYCDASSTSGVKSSEQRQWWQRPEDVPPPPDPPRPRTERLGMSWSRINKWGSQWMSVPFKLPIPPHGFWRLATPGPWKSQACVICRTSSFSSLAQRGGARWSPMTAEPYFPIFSPKPAVWRCLEGFVFWKGVIWDFKGWWSQET